MLGELCSPSLKSLLTVFFLNDLEIWLLLFSNLRLFEQWENKMIKLGIFRTQEKNSYGGHYFPESKKVEAVGPLNSHVGTEGHCF